MTDESTSRARLERLLSEDPQAARIRAAAEADRRTQGRPLVLHGCGQMGRKLAQVLAEDERRPIAFSDNDPAKWGTVVEGVEVLSSKIAVERFGEDAAFVVSKWSPGDGYLDVERQLLDLGAQTVVPLPVFMWRYPQRMLPHYLFALPEAVLGSAGEISVAYRLLADEESRDQFLGQLEWRLWLDYRVLAKPRRLSLQYFEPGIIRLGEHERFVDCGAFDGDTLKSFLRETGGVFERVQAFEPDPDTFQRLKGHVAGLPATVRERITIADTAAVTAMALPIRYDDGFVAYLNGAEIARRNAPATPVWNSLASASPSPEPATETIDVTAFFNTLRNGGNVLAIHGLNSATNSSDFLILPELRVTTAGTGPAGIGYFA